MSNEKIIAVWGSGHTGKSVLSVKLAEDLYERTRATVVVLLTDMTTPMLPVLFPNYRSRDLFSVGTVLSKTNIFRNDIISNLVFLRERQNLGFLGYRTGENRYTFPEFGREKAEEFFAVLSDIADYIIADCVPDPEGNLLSEVSMRNAGTLIRLSAPDLASLSFFQSQSPKMQAAGLLGARQVSVMNVPSQDTMPLVSDFTSHMGAQILLPYSAEVRQQSLDGKLYLPTKDRRYMGAVRSVTKAVAG